MSDKNLLLSALRCEPTERVPWVPFVGVHGGALIGVDATRYLQSADCITEAIIAAAKRYDADGIPVVFDLQMEAEVLGCELAWAKESPPSVASHPLDEDYSLDALPQFSLTKGRMPVAFEAVRRIKAAIGQDVALYGLITGPLTLGLHLRGDDLLLDMFDGEEGATKLLQYCADIGKQMAEGFLDAGADVIAVVDPMLSQIGPAHFEEFVADPLNAIFDHVRAKGGLSSLFVCGNATRNIDGMCATTCDNISVDENVDLRQLATAARAAGKSFGGNLQLTVVLLLGDADASRRNAVECIDAAGSGPGYVLAPGCDLPYAVKPENLEAVAKLVRDPYQMDIVRKLPAKLNDDNFDDITIPDYRTNEAVIVDVVTLDSAGCAPCAYMLSAAREAAKLYSGGVQVIEHKITGRDGLGYMKKLSVSAIPSICIDGVERFASIIPDRKELVECIRSAAASK